MTTAMSGTDEKVSTLRVELDAIASEAAGDPAGVAEDLRGWRARESARQDRVFQIEQRIRDLGTLGLLLDDPAAMAAIRGYVTATAEPRTKLGFAAANRVFNSATSSPPARPLLIGWWKEIHTLSAALPQHEDGDRYVKAEVTAWFRARDGVLTAFILQAGGTDVAAPEVEGNVDRLAGPPRGLAYGVHQGGDQR